MHRGYREPVTSSAWSTLTQRVGARPADPVITWRGADGTRTELSARTLANNVAKAANALRDDAVLDPGAMVAVHLPWHWQRPVWALACWAVDLTVVPDGDPADCELVIAAPDRAAALVGGPDVWVASLHPFGLPNPSIGPGVQDAATIVRTQPDAFTPVGMPTHQALDGMDQPSLLDAAAARPVPARFAVCGEPSDPIDAWLLPTLVPLAHNASIVMLDVMADGGAEAAQEGAQLLH